ncbi:hypothetical protein [Pilimelia columellifera]|uniref:hypothetical protein n=1 Tax=Pilimelia columellifera TaxID=706574 RepID=UPI0031CF557F
MTAPTTAARASRLADGCGPAGHVLAGPALVGPHDGGVRLVSRRHIDLGRFRSAICPAS